MVNPFPLLSAMSFQTAVQHPLNLLNQALHSISSSAVCRARKHFPPAVWWRENREVLAVFRTDDPAAASATYPAIWSLNTLSQHWLNYSLHLTRINWPNFNYNFPACGQVSVFFLTWISWWNGETDCIKKDLMITRTPETRHASRYVSNPATSIHTIS